MDWEQLLNGGTNRPGGTAFNGSLFHPAGSFSCRNDSGCDPDTVNDPDAWEDRRLTCVGFNVMAYDPTRRYLPWTGEDSDSVTYGDQSLANARTNPYNPSSGTDISNHVYFAWTDADNDGEYDGPGAAGSRETPDAGVGKRGGLMSVGNVSSNAGGVAVSSLPTADPNNPNVINTQEKLRQLVQLLPKARICGKAGIVGKLSVNPLRGLVWRHFTTTAVLALLSVM